MYAGYMYSSKIFLRILASAALVMILFFLANRWSNLNSSFNNQKAENHYSKTQTGSLLNLRFKDYLTQFRPNEQVSDKIVLINVGGKPVYPEILKWLFVLEEFNNSGLYISTDIKLLSDSSRQSGEQEIKKLLDSEYFNIIKNMRAAFEAIHYGSVRSKDIPTFIDAMESLLLSSKERLNNSIFKDSALKADTVADFKGLFGNSWIENVEDSAAYVPHKKNYIAFLDTPKTSPIFSNQINFTEIKSYLRLDEILHDRLIDMEKAAYMNGLPSAQHPIVAYDLAATLYKELLDGQGSIDDWKKARLDYIDTLHSYTKYLKKIASGFDALLEANTETTVINSTQVLKNTFLMDIAALDLELSSFDNARQDLSKKLDNKLAVISGSTQIEESAVMINSALHGRWLIVPATYQLALWIAVPALLAVFICSALGLIYSFMIGSFFSLLVFLVYSFFYIRFGLWLSPITAGCLSFAATVSSILCAFLINLPKKLIINKALARKTSYKANFSIFWKPLSLPEGYIDSIIVAIRDSSFAEIAGSKQSDYLKTDQEQAFSIKTFHAELAALVKQLNGIVLYTEDKLVIACLEPSVSSKQNKTEIQFEKLIKALSNMEEQHKQTKYVGIAYGKCWFYTSAIEGLVCSGIPFIHARLLSALAPEYSKKVLASEGFIEHLNPKNTNDTKNCWQRLDSLASKENNSEVAFYGFNDLNSICAFSAAASLTTAPPPFSG